MNFPKDITQEKIKELKVDFTRFRMAYKFAIDEMTTKLTILNEEFNYIHDYNPIEHISTHLKPPDSLVKKVLKKRIHYRLIIVKKISEILLVFELIVHFDRIFIKIVK